MYNFIDQKDHVLKPIVANNLKVKIEKIELNKKQEGVLDISLRLLEGDNRDKILVDRVAYYPNMSLTWKYYALREAAGVPYSSLEPQVIDINELLLNKEIMVDLNEYNAVSKNGKAYKGQQIRYLKPSTPLVINHEECYYEEELPFNEEDENMF